MGLNIVGTDRNDGHALRLHVSPKSGQFIADMFYKGAMITNEHDDHRRRFREIVAPYDCSVRIRKCKCRCNGSKREHG